MSVKKLKEFAAMTNIAEEIEDLEIAKIGQKVLSGFEEDLKSSEEWLADAKRIEKLASLKSEKKNTPLPNSANVKLPLITKACYEWSSRTYPEIIKDNRVVKGAVIGKDPQLEKQKQAERISKFMNYQLLYQSQDWEVEQDRLLHLVGLYGFVCKKTYYEPVKKEIKSEICDFKDLIISANSKSLADAPRISHIIHLRLNNFIEAANADVFCQEAVDDLIKMHENDEFNPSIDVVEQHTWLDLDEDGYAEPYIVTILKNTGKVLRIAPRFTEENIITKDGEENKLKYIDAVQFFTDYHFLVSPTGQFQSVGFGILLLHLNEACNTILNQLIDAGQLANLQGGYMSADLQPMGSGDTLHDPGEWKRIKSLRGTSLKDGIYPISYKEPSSVLYNLLGLLIQSARDLSSSTEIMTGGHTPENAKTGATNALINEGMKVFTSIQKRVYRSLSSEYRKIFRLNGIYLDPNTYVEVIGGDIDVSLSDFDTTKVDVLPVADPNLSTDSDRAQENQVLMALQAMPGINPEAVTKRILLNTSIQNPEELLLKDTDPKVPNPDVIKLQADIQSSTLQHELDGKKLELDMKKFALDAHRAEAEIEKIKADAVKSLAEAGAVNASVSLNDYKLQLEALDTAASHVKDAQQQRHDREMHDNEMNMRQQEIDSNAEATDSTGMEQPSSDSGTA